MGWMVFGYLKTFSIFVLFTALVLAMISTEAAKLEGGRLGWSFDLAGKWRLSTSSEFNLAFVFKKKSNAIIALTVVLIIISHQASKTDGGKTGWSHDLAGEAVNCYTYNYEDFLFCSWNSSTADSVKPAPVQNVSLVGTTPYCVTLQWSCGRGYLWSVLYPQLYQITCLAISPEGQQHPSDNSTWIVNSTRFEVCGLLPYTKYLIKVAAIPQEGGIWSEIPGLPPYVHINSFTTISRGNGAYSGLMIFWREIQKQRIYGSHLRYVVSVCPYNTSQEPRDCTEETVFNFARFQIPAQQEITTRIWSKNEIGTSRDFALIRIPSKDELLQSPDILVVVSGSLTTVFLDIAQQKDVRFTKFCKINHCLWMESLVTPVMSSSELPGLLEMTLTHTEEDHLEVTWRIPSCNMRLVSAVVDHYVLSFCSTSDCMSENI
uniref:Uncharacterized protein n=1 Tax=Magallana gigas TaxID=29159 RepID=K1S0G1_MAGGI